MYDLQDKQIILNMLINKGLVRCQDNFINQFIGRIICNIQTNPKYTIQSVIHAKGSHSIFVRPT